MDSFLVLPFFSFLFILCCCFLLPGPMHAQKVPGVYVLGDSLVDVGNNDYFSSTARANFPHNGVDYPNGVPTGRFSNGYNSADFIAEKVGLPSSPPYLSLNSSSSLIQGVSFASGGAGILNTTNPDECLTLDQQMEYFSNVSEALVQHLGASNATQHLSASLFVIVIGSNDLFKFFDGETKADPQQFVDSLVSKLKDKLMRLYNLAARKLVFFGTGPIGCVPLQRSHNSTGDCNAELNYWSVQFNEGVSSLLQSLKSQYGDLSYSFLDAYTTLLQYIQNPATFGFVEVKAACCGLGNLNAQIPCIPVATYCSNRTNHVFWDFYHPTETVAHMLVNTLFNGSTPYVYPINARKLVTI